MLRRKNNIKYSTADKGFIFFIKEKNIGLFLL